MYCLNDEHPEYEYTLYVCVSGACPYFAGKKPFKEKEIPAWIKYIEKHHHNKYDPVFYIDNDFYKNGYNGKGGTYYKFMRRRVNDWEDFTKDEIFIPYMRAL